MVSFKDRLRRAAKKVIDKAIEVLESDDEGPSNRDRGPQLRRACSESDANRLRQADQEKPEIRMRQRNRANLYGRIPRMVRKKQEETVEHHRLHMLTHSSAPKIWY